MNDKDPSDKQQSHDTKANLSSSSSSSLLSSNKEGRKQLLVVKRKKAPPKRVAIRGNRGLPKFNATKRAEAVVTTNKNHHKAVDPNLNNDDNDDDNDAMDQLLSTLPNDCALCIQSLQQDKGTSLAIPIPRHDHHHHQQHHHDNHVIRGVLEYHVRRKMQQRQDDDDDDDDDGGDIVVSRELTELLATNQIRQLGSPSTTRPALHVLVFTADYIRAAQGTMLCPDNEQDISGRCATDWMIRQLPYLTGHWIAYADWQERWTANPILTTSLDAVLDVLLKQQLLLVSPLEQSYQLWLPTWGGLVLPAWEKARKRALLHLKRSAYKERSLSAMQQTYDNRSPIPTKLLLDWMESVGHVEWMDRPAGKFVRLPSHCHEDE